MHQINELIIEVSHNCNLSCIMCGYGQAPFSQSKFMPMHLFTKVLKTIGPYAEKIRLNGRGESTIHPKFLQMISTTRYLFPEKNINLFTNLSVGDDAIIQSFIKYDVNLFLSIDSPRKDSLEYIRQGARYETIIDNLTKLETLSIRPHIIATLQEENLYQIVDIGKFALEKNCHILFNIVRRDKGIEPFLAMVQENLNGIQRDFTQVHEMFAKSSLQCSIPDQITGVPLNLGYSTETYGVEPTCPATTNEVCVLYNGDIIPCNMFNPYVFGNLHTASIDDIMNGKRRESFLNHRGSHYYCKNCACMGGT